MLGVARARWPRCVRTTTRAALVKRRAGQLCHRLWLPFGLRLREREVVFLCVVVVGRDGGGGAYIMLGDDMCMPDWPGCADGGAK